MKIKLTREQWEKVGKKSGWLKKQAQTTIHNEQEGKAVAEDLLRTLETIASNTKGYFNIERKELKHKGSDDQIQNNIIERAKMILANLYMILNAFPKLGQEFRARHDTMMKAMNNKFGPIDLEGEGITIDNEGDTGRIEQLKNKALDDWKAGKITEEQLKGMMSELVAKSTKNLKKSS